MEEEDTRRFQRNKGRFGIRTNKTLKYSRDETRSRRKENLDTIVVVDADNDMANTMNGRQLLGISLNARKNWELLENQNRNSLNSSQDDMDVNYGPRIVVVEDEHVRSSSKPTKWGDYHHKFYGPNSDIEVNEKESETEVVSGTNRKGFFVKEKRKKGKKGVLKPQANRARSQSFNNKSDSSESDSDSAIDEPEKDNRLIIASIKPKNPDYVRHKDKLGCGCTLCNGKNNKVVTKREIIRDLDAL